MITTLLRKTPAISTDSDITQTPKHLGWLMLTALGMGATIGAGIFAMPGMIARKAGPAGIFSFLLTGMVIMCVGVAYEKFALKVPSGTSAYSYVYHSIGEIFAWIIALGLFFSYSFGASAVSIAWCEYLKNAINLQLPSFWNGSTFENGQFHFGVNIIAISVITMVTTILVAGGVNKSAKLNFALVCLKLILLSIFLIAGFQHINPGNWTPFAPKGLDGILKGAALAVFPYVGFDALYTFAREAKSTRDTQIATYLCIGLVAMLYVIVMLVATGLAPCFINGLENKLFVGSEAAAPLANLLSAVGETWCAKFIAFGAVLGIFNVLLVLCMGAPRIFRSMAEDGLLPAVFLKSKAGNPVVGIILNGIMVSCVAGFVPFGQIADLMVLGTLVAFMFVSIGALKIKIINPIIGLLGALGCLTLIFSLDPIVLKSYAVILPIGIVIYLAYGRKHSKLAKN